LTGSIPLELFDCSQLKWLYLDNNHFTGDHRVETAFSVFNKRLLELTVNNNSLTGTMPTTSFALVPSLSVFWMSGNHISGSLSPELFQLESLRLLDLSDMALVGSIPQNIGSCISLLWLLLSGNALTGSLPDSVNDLHSLRRLDVGDNQFSGRVENLFSAGRTSNITDLMLNDNRFSGPLPRIVFNSSFGLQVVLLQNNLFKGQLINNPELAVALDGQSLSLINLDVSGNKLEGTIPSSIFDSSKLLSVAMSSNCMFTPISSDFCKASNLMVLAMDGLNSACSSDSLTPRYIGTIPDCLFAMRNLTTLHLSGLA
jgi:Leucine-rich repeat (LRR) protein